MSAGADLDAQLESPGYTPRRRDVPRLLSRLGDAPDDLAKAIERALVRVGPELVPLLVARVADAGSAERARLVALAGRLLGENPEPALWALLEATIGDPEPLVRRRAITALGKTGAGRAEPVFLQLTSTELALPELRALVVALGNVGGQRSLDALERISVDDGEVRRVLAEARRKIERRSLRAAPSGVDAARVPDRAFTLLLHARRGLEAVLVDEIDPAAAPSVVGDGRVLVTWSRSLADLFVARTFLHFGFPLPEQRAPAGEGDVAAAVTRALASDEAFAILSTFGTEGPLRYRIEWANAGRKRAATFDVAERVRAARPRLVNDPVAAPWEAVVTERRNAAGVRVFVELWPRGLVDPRFAHRTQTLPASSHPTLAAALVRLAGVKSTDVVWDPFVGSAVELCECALAAPGARLVGTDLDARALQAARENLRAAGAREPELVQADALTFVPSRAPTLILTNPPFGRRVRSDGNVQTLLERFVARAATVLAPGGRLVWVSPRAQATAAAARHAGLVLETRRPVDVGGIAAEIQIATRAPGVASRQKPERTG